MSKIKILLSAKSNAQFYIDAVEGFGGEAYVKYLPQADTSYDGLILCGGGDMDPKYYGEPIDGSVSIDALRDANEISLLEAYAKAGKPVLGICRGCQLINVFFGGSLYQHLPEADLHRSIQGADQVHPVKAVEGSILNRLYGASFSVNSSHHQAIKELGKDLIAAAYWEDKYIEACEHTRLPVFGVQWHPERMCFSKARSDTAGGGAIFEYFLDLCKNH